MAQPDAGSDVDAGDRHGVLGGLALSSPDEAVSRGNAGEGCGGVNVWSGDVAIAYIAMTHGAPMPYVVAILCTLGIISVFSLSVLGKTISWRLAGATYATVAALGIVAGVITRGF